MNSTHSINRDVAAATELALGERIRTDVRGRVWAPREQREKVLDEFERSGLSGAAFARLAGINYATFANWRQKRRKRTEGDCASCGKTSGSAQLKAASLPNVQLVEACVESDDALVEAPQMNSSPAAASRIVLPGGAQLAIETAMQARLAAELLVRMNQGARA